MDKPAEPGRREVIEAVVASTVGTMIEWYDFFLYGFAATLVFRPLYFPDVDPFLGQLAAFGTFTVGFIARPLGGVLFGWMGDRVGRKSTLVATLLLMGISTMLIGIVPTYEHIGMLAPIALVVLRFVQGLGVGGEWGGAVLLALEYGHRGGRGFYASWPQAGVPLGLLASGGVLTLFRSLLSEDEFMTWGWRVPFLLSGLLIAVGLVIRFRILETPLFAELQATNQVSKSPIRETLTLHWREVLLAGGARIVENASFYIFTIYALDYAEKVLKIDKGIVLFAVNVAAVIQFFAIPCYGVLSDRWSRKGMYVLGCLIMAGFAFPYFAMLDTRNPTAIVLATVLALCVGHAMLYSVQASLIPELFGTRLRYTGSSIGYQLASPFAGGIAPIVAATLVKLSGGASWPLALYIIGMAGLSLTCVLMLAETSKKDIRVA